MAKKRKSAAKAAVADEPSPLEVPTTYPGKGMPEAQWQACTQMLDHVLQARDGSRRISDIFLELPDKEDYADYYEAIPEPECLENLADQLEQGTYATPESFFNQLHLIFLNACFYNEENSLVWTDAKTLEKAIHADWEARAAEGIFSSPDPYHIAAQPQGRKRGRPPKNRDSSSAPSVPRGSATPAPSAPPASIAAPVPAATRAPSALAQRPQTATASSSRASAPPAKPPAPSPSPAMIRPSAPPAPPPPAPARQAQMEADRQMMARLDATLPKWEGPLPVLQGPPIMGGVPGCGWWGEGAPDYEARAGGMKRWQERIKAVVSALTEYRDSDGVKLSETISAVPAVVNIPYLSFSAPLSFSSIHLNASASRYRTLRDFDLDVSRLFEKARRFFAPLTREYGHVMSLQRLYNALTAPYPLEVPSRGVLPPSPTSFASVSAGPGNARSLHATTDDEAGLGVTTYRISTKDRVFTDEARQKGLSIRIGDYVHLINPDDPSRPIIAQVFKTFVPTKGARTHHVTVCWYHRPEQTVHPAKQLFLENEVFKTGHMCDHPVEDILERITVQFYVKWVRGRPNPPEFYPGWPSYVCVSRYNDRENLMVRVKNWNSCIPDELRQTSFMSVVPYERLLEPVQFPSPFHYGVRGPGHFGEPKTKAGAEEDDEEEEDDLPKKKERVPERVMRNTRGAPLQHPGPVPQTAQPSSYATPPQTAAVSAPLPGSSRSSQLPQQPMASRPSAPPSASPLPSISAQLPPAPPNTRSIAVQMGGQQIMDQSVYRDMLPPETSRLFERDIQQRVLWFSGPPLPFGAIKVPQPPSHSLEYLVYRANKRKGIDGARAPTGKRVAVADRGTVQQDEEGDVRANHDRSWWAKGQSTQQVAAALQAVIDSA